MSRPLRVTVPATSGWDSVVNGDFEKLVDGPLPIYRHVGDESDLPPATKYRNCLVWVDHTEFGWTLYHEVGGSWVPVGLKRSIRVVTGDDDVVDADDVVFVNSSDPVDLTLPDPAANAGRAYVIKRVGTGDLTVLPNDAETIDGALSYVVENRYSAVSLLSDGTDWLVSREYLHPIADPTEIANLLVWFDAFSNSDVTTAVDMIDQSGGGRNFPSAGSVGTSLGSGGPGPHPTTFDLENSTGTLFNARAFNADIAIDEFTVFVVLSRGEAAGATRVALGQARNASNQGWWIGHGSDSGFQVRVYSGSGVTNWNTGVLWAANEYCIVAVHLKTGAQKFWKNRRKANPNGTNTLTFAKVTASSAFEIGRAGGTVEASHTKLFVSAFAFYSGDLSETDFDRVMEYLSFRFGKPLVG